MSTNFETKFAYRNRLVAVSTAAIKSSAATGFPSTEATWVPPGFKKTTVGAQCQFPIEKPGAQMFLHVMYDSPCTGSTAGCYAQVDVMKAVGSYSPAWAGQSGGTIASSGETFWDSFLSTSLFIATSTEAESYVLGPIDTAKYAQNFGGTSSNSIDKYQNFLAVMIGYSTTATAATHDALSTNAPIGAYYVQAMELR